MDREPIVDAVVSVTAKWAKQRKAEERDANRKLNRSYALARRTRISIKEAAWAVMKEAYLRASADGTLPAHARQIMYQARPGILGRATDCGVLDDAYFTQALLPDYMAEHPEETANWDVVFDARGTLHEPHTDRDVPLGTLAVRRYLNDVSSHVVRPILAAVRGGDTFPTIGPENRYGAILFIEKEGFMPLFESVRLAEKYDIALMSTKGMSTTAARGLVDRLCDNVPLFVTHDFDKAGFSILGTLGRSTRRYCFTHPVNVIDFGLRLTDVRKYGLQSEVCHLKSDPTANLTDNGATEEEIEFLSRGQRVELNAFTSDQLVQWVESKLQEHRVEKVVPEAATLEAAYRRVALAHILNNRLAEVMAEAEREVNEMKVDPQQVSREVRKRLADQPLMAWDEAVASIVRTDRLGEQGGGPR